MVCALVGGVGWVVGDVGGALVRPGLLDQDLAVGGGEGDGAGVPDCDHLGTGQVAVDQERGATDVDGAVAADGQLALPGGTDGLVPTHPAPSGVVLLWVWASWGDGGGVVVRSGCLLTRDSLVGSGFWGWFFVGIPWCCGCAGTLRGR